MEIFVTFTPSSARAVHVELTDRIAEYGRALSDAQLWRLFCRIADRTHLDEFGDYGTYAACYPQSYRALRALDAVRAERSAARIA